MIYKLGNAFPAENALSAVVSSEVENMFDKATQFEL